MSSPAGPSGRDSKGKKGFGKVLSNLTRVRTMLKKPGDSSKRQSSGAHASRIDEPTETEVVRPATPTQLEEQQQPTTSFYPEYEGATRIPRAQIHEERARKLGISYGLDIQPGEWDSTDGDVLRVEKPVRIRIHRQCHRCSTDFGAGNKCQSCSHMRCSRCIRIPAKRTDEEKKERRERRAELAQMQPQFEPIAPHYGMADPIVVTRPSRTGGQPVVHKPPRMRVRRTCHRCSTLFTSSTRVCEQCGHRRCDDCSKTPHKKKKYPYGYPGDEQGENSPLFHSCHECATNFPPNAPDGEQCTTCYHPKCADCPRIPRKKVEPAVDLEALRGISARFEQLNVS
ncbi:hypothetical protein BX600DRAFT_14520 [Xylariales sp. PMI_506]|nr:hypothetical protein BX600DRAFT_14520 [Xylariales sp. PMI_506]